MKNEKEDGIAAVGEELLALLDFLGARARTRRTSAGYARRSTPEDHEMTAPYSTPAPTPLNHVTSCF